VLISRAVTLTLRRCWRVRHVLVAVNKMDLIGYDEAALPRHRGGLQRRLDQIAADTGNPVERIVVPVSALKGDNIVHKSNAMDWYKGPSLPGVVENRAALGRHAALRRFDFRCNACCGPDHTFRGFAGQIAFGNHSFRRCDHRVAFG